jgi:LPXTG-motif cell wall-anchored protein
VFDFSAPEANEGWGDIIPAAPGVTPRNDGEAGLAILANGCNGPQQGSCPDGSQPVDGSCSTEETCPSGEPAEGGECPDEPELCAFDEELFADDPGCTEPEPCSFDEERLADDPGCTEPEPCSFDVALDADDPDCVEAVVIPNDPPTPADPKAPIEVLPSVTRAVAAAPAPAETLPVTGHNTGTLALVGAGLVALGSALVATQRRREQLG